MKQQLFDNVKNIYGWRTQRKMVAFAVDDYANVRVDSPAAYESLRQSGLDMSSQMDRTDTLETRQDLERLFETLDSVKDTRDQPAIFTAYVLSSNPDFERILEEEDGYHSELVPQTFKRLAREQADAYAGAWECWQEGIERKLLHPQFHGREHLNIRLFEYKLASRSPDLMANLKQRSMAGIAGDAAFPGIGFSHAYGVLDRKDPHRHLEIIRAGIEAFKKSWGFRPTTFTPPALKLHPDLADQVVQHGLRAVHKPLHCKRSLGDGRQKREINHSGPRRNHKHLTIVRNVVFEPCKPMGFDPVARAIHQIEAAFRWKRPAIISSHRANFCGHLDPTNREKGVAALHLLLKEIVSRWPDVEFVTTSGIVEALGGAGGNRR